jgi:branched-chain amino acid transport system permease protein
VACLVGVALMLQKTRIGKAMRAVSDDIDLAESSGIDVRRVILFVWVMGAGLAGLGGVLQASATTVNYLNGFQLLLLMFAAVILGGLGTAYGAMVGGIVVGLATEISTVWLSSELKFVWALAVLIAVLLVRPQGILGEKERVA